MKRNDRGEITVVQKEEFRKKEEGGREKRKHESSNESENMLTLCNKKGREQKACYLLPSNHG